MIKGRPRRLHQIFQSCDPALYFVTICTLHRRPFPALHLANVAFREYALRAQAEFNVAVGRYVIMPDHLHLFVQGGQPFDLSLWVRGLKRVLSAVLKDQSCESIWQPGFFDHVLRSEESYAQKWAYVRDNAVRKGLVKCWEDWPHQGEIVQIDRV